MSETPIIDIKNIDIFQGDSLILKNVSLQLHKGEVF